MGTTFRRFPVPQGLREQLRIGLRAESTKAF
jgi:hypothetical protein